MHNKDLKIHIQHFLANLYIIMSSTLLMIDKISAVVYDLQVSFLVSNYKSILLRERKNISRTISMLVLANKKIFPKNRTFLKPSWSKISTRTILQVPRIESSIFYEPTLVYLIFGPDFIAKAGVIALILLLKLINTPVLMLQN